MSIELTALSEQILEETVNHVFTAQEAYAYLENGITLRTFKETLTSLAGKGVDVQETLETQLAAYNPGMGIQPESFHKKVSGWLNGVRRPKTRETVFQICFALGLDADASNRLLTAIEEPQIHYRDPRELVYAFCLRNHLPYAQAQALLRQIPAVAAAAPEHTRSTTLLQKDFGAVQTKEELLEFIEKYKRDMGAFHERAYQRFMEMMKPLRNPYPQTKEEAEEAKRADKGAPKAEEDYSFETIAQQYLRMHVPLNRDLAEYDELQKGIKKYWPNESMLTLMSERKKEVNRKTLLLLYVVTEGGSEAWNDDLSQYATEKDYPFDFPNDSISFLVDEGELTPREQFEYHFWRVNLMLDDCGMGTLDPRNEFDWLILYTLRYYCEPEGFFGMSDGLEAVLAQVFPDEE